MTSARFTAHVLSLAITSSLLAQLPSPPFESPETLDSSESTSIPGITRVLIRTEKLVSGSKLWVKNRNGDIRVVGWEKEEMHLTAEIRDTDRRRVELIIQQKEGDLDIETVFLYPWAVTFGSRGVGWFVFYEMLIFVAILMGGLAYAWKEGALKWR